MRLIDATTLKSTFTGNFSETYPPAQIKALIDIAQRKRRKSDAHRVA